MTIQEMNTMIERVMATIAGEVAASGDIPVVTGNLRSAVKVRRAPYGFDIFVDTDIAPYGASVNENRQYWRRVALMVHDRLRSALGSEFTTNYNPRGGEA